MFDLTGRYGIVTGTSSGIGLAIASVLAEAGAVIYGISRSGTVKDASISTHPNLQHIKGDVCDLVQMKALIDKIGNDTGIDFLINNAGITVKRRAEEITEDEFDKVMEVNVKSLFHLCCYCYPYLRKSSFTGRIINISSMAAHLGFSEVVPYCTSKAAVLGLTRGLSVEWASNNITVNSIAPGWFPSEMNKQVMTPERKDKILARMPLHRFGETKDIGALALYLLSDTAIYVTGQDFAIDGGALSFGF